MPYAITTTLKFIASHQLRLYDGQVEPLHEHVWRVKLTAGSAGLDSIGVVMDFHELTRLLTAVIQPLRGSLNEIPELKTNNPSAENVAAYIGRRLVLPYGVRLTAVEVWETEENSAIFTP